MNIVHMFTPAERENEPKGAVASDWTCNKFSVQIAFDWPERTKPRQRRIYIVVMFRMRPGSNLLHFHAVPFIFGRVIVWRPHLGIFEPPAKRYTVLQPIAIFPFLFNQCDKTLRSFGGGSFR